MRAVEGEHLLGVVADGASRGLTGRPQRFEGRDDAGLRVRRQRRHLAPGIGEELQRPRRRDAGIELAQRARRRIARVGEHLVAGLPPAAR